MCLFLLICTPRPCVDLCLRFSQRPPLMEMLYEKTVRFDVSISSLPLGPQNAATAAMANTEPCYLSRLQPPAPARHPQADGHDWQRDDDPASLFSRSDTPSDINGTLWARVHFSLEMSGRTDEAAHRCDELDEQGALETIFRTFCDLQPDCCANLLRNVCFELPWTWNRFYEIHAGEHKHNCQVEDHDKQQQILTAVRTVSLPVKLCEVTQRVTYFFVKLPGTSDIPKAYEKY